MAKADGGGEKTDKKPKDKKVPKDKTEKKSIFKQWWFWLVAGAIVLALAAGVVMVILFMNGKKGSQGIDEPKGDFIAACKAGNKELLSGGEWIVGKDIASGDYRVTTTDKSFYGYFYENAEAKDYLRSISISSGGSSFLHLTNGQKIKVSSNSINMECQDLGDIKLVSASATLKAGTYTVVAVDKSLYAYLYEQKGASSYTATISISERGGTKDMRFKDDQWLKMSSGSAFLIDMSSDKASELVEKAKKLANDVATLNSEENKEEKTEEKKEENKEESSSSSSSSNNSSSSSSNTSTSNNTASAEWRQFVKDYEAWVDKYVAFMKKYKNAGPSEIAGMMSDYTSLLSEMSNWSSRAESIKGTLSSGDIIEYASEITRITQKMNEIK